DRIGRTSLGAIFLEPIDVALHIAKFEGVGRHFRRRQLLIFAFVEKARQTRLSCNRHGITGARNHKAVTAPNVLALGLPSISEALMASTKAEPTTTPSALAAIAAALEAFLTPK